MYIAWDNNKNRANKAKHGVCFEVAKRVFDDPCHLSVQDRIEGRELRWKTLGRVGDVVVLLVAHTWQERGDDEIIRIISARKATPRERRHYEQGY